MSEPGSRQVAVGRRRGTEAGRRSERKSFGSTAIRGFGRLEEPCGRRRAGVNRRGRHGEGETRGGKKLAVGSCWDLAGSRQVAAGRPEFRMANCELRIWGTRVTKTAGSWRLAVGRGRGAAEPRRAEGLGENGTRGDADLRAASRCSATHRVRRRLPTDRDASTEIVPPSDERPPGQTASRRSPGTRPAPGWEPLPSCRERSP